MAGTGKATIREVARMAGVHPGTASRALNAGTRALVNERTARRVDQAARQLHYRPNHSARSLKTRRSDTIGVLIPDLTNPLFPPIVRGIEDRLALDGFVAVLGNTDNDEERERIVFDRMQSRHVDGFILATARRNNAIPGAVGWVDEPVVLVNRVSDDASVPSVSVDDSAGMWATVQHLAGLGHRRIAHVAGPQFLSTGYGRYHGFLKGMRDAELTANPELIIFADYFSEAEGYRCGQQLLGSGPFTAIVAANDSLALGVLLAIQEAGVDCPGQLSLTGFNDMAFVDRVQPALTTVRVPQYQLGYQAAQLMLERLKEGDSATTKAVLLRPELVVRRSTGPVNAAAARPSSRPRKGGAGK
jgi:LacI family transcriptional regulator